MLDEYLEGYRDAEGYDLDNAGDDPDYPLVERLARSLAGPLLDLACGTGTIAIRLAEQGYEVTGVDIVPEMIALATQKATAHGASIDWLVADARDFRLQNQFRLIYMLGHSFQHFLTRTDQEALFARVREHLHPEGRFLFSTRNPTLQNLYEARYPGPCEGTAPDGRNYVATERQVYDPITQIQHYTFRTQWFSPDGVSEERSARTALRYVFPREIEALLFYNGFTIAECYGDWQLSRLTAESPEMIYVCQMRADD